MPAYVSHTVSTFVEAAPEVLLGELHSAYAADGFASQYTSQSKSWQTAVDLLQQEMHHLLTAIPATARWPIFLELPLYRLRRRIDVVVLAPNTIFVLEMKVGAADFSGPDRRQVEEYALDLRDFHRGSCGIPIVPALWCTSAPSQQPYLKLGPEMVRPVHELGANDLSFVLAQLARRESGAASRIAEPWDAAGYEPVPTVIEAATTMFSGHGVEEIARADAGNLATAAKCVVGLVESAKRDGQRSLVFVTGVPGSGKTLAGLQVVHESVEQGVEQRGDIVYLSGNTPLVTVLREALARDDHSRRRSRGEESRIGDVRSAVRARIQHIIDFLREYLTDQAPPPHEHAIVFDEAQRAWDAKQGKKKFGRTASEPQLLLEIMGRKDDWCVLVGLVGGGQEINTGENGMAEWGEAIRSLGPAEASRWTVYCPPAARDGDSTTANLGLGELPIGVRVHQLDELSLTVPLRAYRSPRITDWIDAVISGDQEVARRLSKEISEYPIMLTRSLAAAKRWLHERGRGERRYGLVASSGARRLRAEGMGVTLNATDGMAIAQWYLNPRVDVRSSYSLEVMANEYTTQGLELDFVGLCWGGDFVRSEGGSWAHRRFAGTKWSQVRSEDRRRFTENSYRVLMSRAREGLVIWIPTGSPTDPTRAPRTLDATAKFLQACGAVAIEDALPA